MATVCVVVFRCALAFSSVPLIFIFFNIAQTLVTIEYHAWLRRHLTNMTVIHRIKLILINLQISLNRINKRSLSNPYTKAILRPLPQYQWRLYTLYIFACYLSYCLVCYVGSVPDIKNLIISYLAKAWLILEVWRYIWWQPYCTEISNW